MDKKAVKAKMKAAIENDPSLLTKFETDPAGALAIIGVELDDDDLDNVTGGGVKSRAKGKGKTVTDNGRTFWDWLSE